MHMPTARRYKGLQKLEDVIQFLENWKEEDIEWRPIKDLHDKRHRDKYPQISRLSALMLWRSTSLPGLGGNSGWIVFPFIAWNKDLHVKRAERILQRFIEQSKSGRRRTKIAMMPGQEFFFMAEYQEWWKRVWLSSRSKKYIRLK